MNDAKYFPGEILRDGMGVRCKNVISRSFLKPKYPHVRDRDKFLSVFETSNIAVGDEPDLNYSINFVLKYVMLCFIYFFSYLRLSLAISIT